MSDFSDSVRNNLAKINANADQLRAQVWEELEALDMGTDAFVAIDRMTTQMYEQGTFVSPTGPRRGTVKMLGLLAQIGLLSCLEHSAPFDVES